MKSADRESMLPGDADYSIIGAGYNEFRRPDAHIERRIHAALGGARRVLNIGAGAGSYEPTDRYVIAVEPSADMRAMRPSNLPPALVATAESLPLDDDAVDTAMAVLTIHHWPNLEAGLSEIRRVTNGPVAIVTFDPLLIGNFWLMDYAPELCHVEAHRYPSTAAILNVLGSGEVANISIASDCVDGFTEAYFSRPEAFLDPRVRRAQSAWSFVEPGVEDRVVATLAADLTSGRWDELYGSHRNTTSYEGALLLIVA
jgi:SAM-dependent methyltransferase